MSIERATSSIRYTRNHTPSSSLISLSLNTNYNNNTGANNADNGTTARPVNPKSDGAGEGRYHGHTHIPKKQCGETDVGKRRQSWMNDYFGPHRLGKATVTFTGPDGLGPQRMNVQDEHRYVGNNTMSSEGTSDLDYIWRKAPNISFPRSKAAFPGSIGWGVTEFEHISFGRNRSPILLGPVWQRSEDMHSHIGQDAWWPPYEHGKLLGANYERPKSAPATIKADSCSRSNIPPTSILRNNRPPTTYHPPPTRRISYVTYGGVRY